MARERKEEPPAGAPLWLATYGDMMTLVLCFFVLLFSMSTIDESKLEEFNEAFMDNTTPFIIDFGSMGITEIMGNGIIEFPSNSSQEAEEVAQDSNAERQDRIDEYIGDIERGLQNAYGSPFENYEDYEVGAPEIRVDMVDQTLEIVIGADALFDSGSAELTSNLDISALAEVILDIYTPGDIIVIEGHTDSVPQRSSSGRYYDNWELSAGRAASVLRALSRAPGLESAKFEIKAQADNVPVDTNETEEGRARNRRVVIYISSPSFLGTVQQ